ncbi:hypothetical protein CA54_35110 [Symmachiella macrocystis]|uniref:Uncharacterized protein n=1 Tax=Symmachiella macrocystis TaxID=2527985 RepID=A0A5C6BSE2_9PLAN|nr:hypothetical protein [Symmachiella macrocystis]TWU14642.1 hypothetical protein CA54_35110 [Symmachiella macrocystis]
MARIFHLMFASFVLVALAAPSVSAQEETPAPVTEAAAETQAAETEPAAAAEPQGSGPLVTFMFTNANEFLADLKFLMGKGHDEDKALENLQLLLLDPYLVGLDPKNPPVPSDKPSGAVVYLEDAKLQTVLFFPVQNEAEFFDTISDVGIDNEEVGGGFYAISGEVFPNSHARLANGYVYFAESKALLLRDLPKPEELFHDFLEKKYDVAAHIDGSSTSIEQRRDAFKEFRKETTGSLKKLKDEEELDFQIRKSVVEFQLDEIERYFSESKTIELGWTTDVEGKRGVVHIELEALPDTELAKTIEVLEQTDGDANTTVTKDYVSYSSTHFLFDKMRQEHMLAISKLLRDKAHQLIGEDEQIADADKENAKKVSDLIFSLLDANTNEGTLFGWMKVLKNEEKQHTLLGQTTVKNVPQIATILTDSGVAELNVDKVADKADIHKVAIYGDYDGLKGQFGDDLAIYIATGAGELQDRVWVGMGHNAVAEIKKAIEANEAAGPVAAQLRIKVGSWVDALIDPESKKAEAPAKKSKRPRRGRRRARGAKKKEAYDIGRIAWQTLGNVEDDILVLTLEKVAENRVVVHEDIDTGLLRFIGKVLAQEINANLK